MNPRLALVAVFALIVVLVFVGYLLERKRAARRRELKFLQEQLADLHEVVDDIRAIAAEGQGLDVTAERVSQRIRKLDRKRVERRIES